MASTTSRRMTIAIICIIASLLFVATSISFASAAEKESGNVSYEQQAMYRMYNPNSGEHFYTANVEERNNIYYQGWNYEGLGWTAPVSSDYPVYRLYNPNAGDHHYTTDPSERDNLLSAGWHDEGTGWYSAGSDGIALYRQYNPNALAGSHNYTTDKSENDHLASIGWNAEGVGWYGVAANATATIDTSISEGAYLPPAPAGGSEESHSASNGSSHANTGVVYWTPNGKRYHSTDRCPTLARSKTILSGSVEEAGSRTPCADCW